MFDRCKCNFCVCNFFSVCSSKIQYGNQLVIACKHSYEKLEIKTLKIQFQNNLQFWKFITCSNKTDFILNVIGPEPQIKVRLSQSRNVKNRKSHNKSQQLAIGK